MENMSGHHNISSKPKANGFILLFPANKEEDSRACKRDVSTIPSAKVSTDKFARASASANGQPSDSAPPTALISLIVSTKLSLSSASPSRWCAAVSSPATGLGNSPTHSSSSHPSHSHFRHNTNIRGQTHSWCSLINRQFSLRWTWHTLSEKSGHSTLRTSHSDLVQGVANNFTWWIYIFIHKILIISFKSLINLSASNDVSLHFQGYFEKPYSSVP